MEHPLKIKLAAIAKDEAAYLPEWIFHHLHCGFDAIDIYVNKTTDNTNLIAEKLQTLPNVSFVNADKIFEQNEYPQEACYRTVFDNTDKNEFAYIMFLDIDEFWFSKDLKKGIKESLHQLNYPDVLCLNWFIKQGETKFSSLYENTLIGSTSRWVKTIFSTKLDIQRIEVHNVAGPNIQYTLANGKKWDFGERLINGAFVKDPFYEQNALDFFVIHRMYRSQMEYVSLLVRGRPTSRGKEWSVFKDNRNGYLGPHSAKEVIQLGSQDIINLQELYAEFLIRYDLKIELETAREFVLKRFRFALHQIRTSHWKNHGILKSILKNVSLPQVNRVYGLFKSRTTERVVSEATNEIRDLAICLEDFELEVAAKLMAIAKEMRPEGKVINQKLNSYLDKLNKDN